MKNKTKVNLISYFVCFYLTEIFLNFQIEKVNNAAVENVNKFENKSMERFDWLREIEFRRSDWSAHLNARFVHISNISTEQRSPILKK